MFKKNSELFLSYIFTPQHGIKKAQLIPVSGAFHTKLMKPAQDPLRQALESVNIHTPRCKVYSGTSCEPFTNPDQIKR